MNFQIQCSQKSIALATCRTLSFKTLKSFIESSFRNLPPNYLISYRSYEEQITLTNDADIKALMIKNTKSTSLFINSPSSLKQNKPDTELKNMNLQQDQHKIQANQSSISSNVDNEVTQIQQNLNKIVPLVSTQIEQQIFNEYPIKEIQQSEESSLQSLCYNIQEMQPENVYHMGISCIKCQCKSRFGLRPKCNICQHQFDFCNQCKNLIGFQHPYLQINNTELNARNSIDEQFKSGINTKVQVKSDQQRLIKNVRNFQLSVMQKARQLSEYLGIPYKKAYNLFSEVYPNKTVKEVIVKVKG